jgi:hypothetical protein
LLAQRCRDAEKFKGKGEIELLPIRLRFGFYNIMFLLCACALKRYGAQARSSHLRAKPLLH